MFSLTLIVSSSSRKPNTEEGVFASKNLAPTSMLDHEFIRCDASNEIRD
jgi:hypothetical protein